MAKPKVESWCEDEWIPVCECEDERDAQDIAEFFYVRDGRRSPYAWVDEEGKRHELRPVTDEERHSDPGA